MEYDGYSEFRKVGPKRLADARRLLLADVPGESGADRNSRHLRAAWYLAGYAVECILKAYIIDQFDARLGRIKHWSQVIDACSADLSGKNSHSLRRLCAVAGLEAELNAVPEYRRRWNACAKWNYNERYNPENMADREEVEYFVESCGELHRWISRRLR